MTKVKLNSKPPKKTPNKNRKPNGFGDTNE
jgi:hypothetical protein